MVCGTWTQWKVLEEMDALDNEMFIRTVELRAGEVEEFQILQDGDWSKVFFPPPGPCGPQSVDAIGPGEAHGRNFFIQAPPGPSRRCTIAFSPELRRVHWQLWSAQDSGQGAASSSAPPPTLTSDPVAATAQRAARAEGWGEGSSFDAGRRGGRRRGDYHKPQEGFFLVGSWDSWQGFTQLRPEAKEEPSFKADVRVTGGRQAEFQIVADRDPSKRYTPKKKVHHRVPVTGGRTIGVAGPSDLPSLHWVLQVPKTCKTMHVTWKPQGEGSLLWEFT